MDRPRHTPRDRNLHGRQARKECELASATMKATPSPEPVPLLANMERIFEELFGHKSGRRQ